MAGTSTSSLPKGAANRKLSTPVPTALGHGVRIMETSGNYSCFNKVTNHELGHAIGLGHTGSCYAVMKQGPYSVPKTPSNNDMYNANRLYPGYTQVPYTC